MTAINARLAYALRLRWRFDPMTRAELDEAIRPICSAFIADFGCGRARGPHDGVAMEHPRGHADIAPSQFERIENDGYLTIDAHWIIPALLRSVPIEGRVLEPAAGRGHLSLELQRAGLDVVSFDLHSYADPLVHDIGTGDMPHARRISPGSLPICPIAISKSWRRI